MNEKDISFKNGINSNDYLKETQVFIFKLKDALIEKILSCSKNDSYQELIQQDTNKVAAGDRDIVFKN